MTEHYQLRCRECGRAWGNAPLASCEDCFSPLEVVYELDGVRRSFTPERIAQRPANIWRYAELLPVAPEDRSALPVGFTPLVEASRLGARLGSHSLYVKNDAVCFPTLSFKDRVVAVALAQARAFGFEVVACSSTGNLANAVAAQAVIHGLNAWILDRKSTRLNSSHGYISYAVFCLKKKKRNYAVTYVDKHAITDVCTS